MQPIEITNGNKTAVVSLWDSKANGSPRFVVASRNGGLTKSFKTLEGAVKHAEKRVGK